MSNNIITCLFCANHVSFLKSIVMHTYEDKDWRICFDCIRIINNKTADRYKTEGWLISQDALLTNDKNNKESA
jgi:hypothetical protein